MMETSEEPRIRSSGGNVGIIVLGIARSVFVVVDDVVLLLFLSLILLLFLVFP